MTKQGDEANRGTRKRIVLHGHRIVLLWENGGGQDFFHTGIVIRAEQTEGPLSSRNLQLTMIRRPGLQL